MPYIVQERRESINQQLDSFLLWLEREADPKFLAGDLNYAFTRIIRAAYDIPETARYAQYNEAIGVLEACKLELYRMFVAPYEEQKRFDNGDV